MGKKPNISIYTQKLIDKLLEIGFTRVDVEKDTSKTNKHWYEIHLFYGKCDMICIDCKYKYEYICTYPFIYDIEKSLCSDFLDLGIYKFYDVGIDLELLKKDFNKFIDIVKDEYFFKQDIKIEESSYLKFYDFIVYFISKFNEYQNKKNIRKFHKKVNIE